MKSKRSEFVDVLYIVVAFQSCPSSSMTAYRLIGSCGWRLLPALMHCLQAQGSHASSNAEVPLYRLYTCR